MPFKRRAGDLGSSFFLCFRKTWRLKTWALKSIEMMQGELLTPLLKVKSGELSRYKIKQHWELSVLDDQKLQLPRTRDPLKVTVVRQPEMSTKPELAYPRLLSNIYD